MTKLSSLARLLACVWLAGSTVACSSDKAQPTADKPTAAEKPVAAAASAPSPVIKAEYAPAELWTTVSGMSRLDIMEKFVDGVGVAATVKAIKDDPVGDFDIEVDAGQGRVIALRFADFGAAAKKKKLAVGAPVAVHKCMITNPQGDHMALVMCELK